MSTVGTGSAENLEANSMLKMAWNGMVDRQRLGLGYQFDWARVLWAIHGRGHELLLLLAREENHLVGVTPLVRRVRWRKGVLVRWLDSLFSFHEVHGTHFITDKEEVGRVDAMVDHLGGMRGSWDLWTMHFVKGDRQAAALEERLRRHRLSFIVSDTKRSPYMELKESWEQQSKGLQSRFRTTVRSRERRLGEKGKVSLEYFDTPGRLEAGLKAIQVIEADSWKLGAGTALTEDPKQWPFYVQYGELAAIDKTLRLPVLFLDGEPIAYDYSILYQGVYYLLKTSYRNSYRQDYPGTVLRKKVIENLCAEQAKEFDFLGLDEEWKLKWTEKSREHVAYTVFNRTLRGRYSYLLAVLAKRMKSTRWSKTKSVPSGDVHAEA